MAGDDITFTIILIGSVGASAALRLLAPTHLRADLSALIGAAALFAARETAALRRRLRRTVRRSVTHPPTPATTSTSAPMACMALEGRPP